MLDWLTTIIRPAKVGPRRSENADQKGQSDPFGFQVLERLLLPGPPSLEPLHVPRLLSFC